MNSESFTFPCPTCGKRFSTSVTDAGADTICPACNRPFKVPDPSDAPHSSNSRVSRRHHNPLLVPLVTVSALLVVAVAALMLLISSGSKSRTVRTGIPSEASTTSRERSVGELTDTRSADVPVIEPPSETKDLQNQMGHPSEAEKPLGEGPTDVPTEPKVANVPVIDSPSETTGLQKQAGHPSEAEKPLGEGSAGVPTEPKVAGVRVIAPPSATRNLRNQPASSTAITPPRKVLEKLPFASKDALGRPPTGEIEEVDTWAKDVELKGKPQSMLLPLRLLASRVTFRDVKDTLGSSKRITNESVPFAKNASGTQAVMSVFWYGTVGLIFDASKESPVNNNSGLVGIEYAPRKPDVAK